ncbi:MAG: bifunctional diaminohydroxyphosphoribosylaminopyrimidine deaminase/5-amino-6-(5-phosphoribosylamino)uracil reductase RibD [Cyanobacteria bacterium REEB67]|nr:bifunctional diaminohydroxyphosphoribosylaminopyrimidine deaminase/5-amino-6-(5-phosphoribosylamino)uracil reductase RibD [Cyanobacteria bacterium REEB67]
MSCRSVDEEYMARALALAGLAEGRTAPNPMVGCLVLDAKGTVVGEGYHQRAGESHAEVFALDQAGDAARGGTLYVTLEPCCHFGRTPPCSQKVIASGVKRVVVGIADPNPKVAGGGLKELQEAGIEVVVGVLEAECRYQNRGFLKSMSQNLPWLALKMAVTLDGKIADRWGKSRWITGSAARQYVMQLRSRFDAVFVGAGTARLDDPSLTVRLENGASVLGSGPPPLPVHSPLRVVLDSELGLRPSAKIFSGGAQGVRTIVFCQQDVLDKKSLAGCALYPDTVEVVGIAGGASGLDLSACLAALKERGVNKVLCEGGAHLGGALLDQNLVDELYWFVAPKLLVDGQALSAVTSTRARALADVSNMKVKEQRILGDDVLIHALFMPCSDI